MTSTGRNLPFSNGGGCHHYLNNWTVNDTKQDIAVTGILDGTIIYKTNEAYYITSTCGSLTSSDIGALESRFKLATLSPDGTLKFDAYEIPFKETKSNAILVNKIFLLYKGKEFYTRLNDSVTVDSRNVNIESNNIAIFAMDGSEYIPFEDDIDSPIFLRRPYFDVNSDGNIILNNKVIPTDQSVIVGGEETKMEHIISISRAVNEKLSTDIRATAHIFKTEMSYFVVYDGWKSAILGGGVITPVTIDDEKVEFIRYGISYPLNISSPEFLDSYMINDGRVHYVPYNNQDYVEMEYKFGALINRNYR